MRVIIHNTIQDKITTIYNFNEKENLTTDSIFTKYNINKELTYLISNGKILTGNEPLKNYDNKIIETRIRLKGGKGGFGSILKAQQAVKKQTKNFDACRDLQGRRLRKLNQEKQLNEWKIKKAEEEKLLQKYIDGLNEEEDLFKKVNNEKRQTDILKKNQKFFEDNERLQKGIKASFKYYINKKRYREKEMINKCNEENNVNDKKEKRKKKSEKIKTIDDSKNEIELIKKMKDEDELLNAILNS